MTTAPLPANPVGLPEPEFSLYGLSNHLRNTFDLMAALCLAIGAVKCPYQRGALTRLATDIEERISVAQECVRRHSDALEQEPRP